MTHVTPAGAVAEDVMERFNAAWNRRDLTAAIELTSSNCAFEAFSPEAAEPRIMGHAELDAVWRPQFEDPRSRLTIEDSFTAGESFTGGTRVVQRWRYECSDGHARGVDITTVRDGLITEILAYVKGRPDLA